MSAKFHSVGIIRLEQSVSSRLAGPCDDSTLDLLLAGLALRYSLADESVPRVQSIRLAAMPRFKWPATREVDVSLRANTAQLTDELQAEFDRAESILL